MQSSEVLRLLQKELTTYREGFEAQEEQLAIIRAQNKAYRRIALSLLAAIELDENIPYVAARARAELEELL